MANAVVYGMHSSSSECDELNRFVLGVTIALAVGVTAQLILAAVDLRRVLRDENLYASDPVSTAGCWVIGLAGLAMFVGCWLVVSVLRQTDSTLREDCETANSVRRQITSTVAGLSSLVL